MFKPCYVGLAAAALALAAAWAAEEKSAMPLGMRLEPIAYPTPEILVPAAKEKLAAERKMLAQELITVYQWKSANAHKIKPLVGEMDPDAVQRIIAELEAGALDTPQDNLARFTKALAARIPCMAKALQLIQTGKYADAEAEMQPLTYEIPHLVGIKQHYRHDTLPPYIYTTVRFLRAECLGREGNLSDATISYHVVYMKLPNSLTLAAPAMIRTAMAYEQTARAHYAIPIYEVAALRYGGSLTDAENLRLANRYTKLSLEDDPYHWGDRRSTEILARLERHETGPLTQLAQKDLLQDLSAMLVMIDEEPRPFLESTMAIVFGASEGKLRSGGITEEFILNERPELNGDDDWGKLRPREKQQLIEAFKEKYPERYSEMLEEYYKRVSEIETQQAEKQP